MVDVVFADVAQPDQARILALNCHHFLKNQGHFVISIKVSCEEVEEVLDHCSYMTTSYWRGIRKMIASCTNPLKGGELKAVL